MVTKERQNLCCRATLEDCHRCFSDISMTDFFLRQLYIKRFFKHIDLFVSPSQFLADRFIAWGLDPTRMRVIENLIEPPVASTAGEAAQAHQGPLRVGFFGQISPLKGIGVLFDAADALAADNDTTVVFEIFGEYRGQPPEFQAEFLKRLAGASTNIRYHGRYEPERVDMLMRSIDVTIVPSIWWENSPVVIQEAFRNRRPVICSNIGGMAEKIRDGIDGWHYPVGNALSLATLLRRLATDRGEVEAVGRTITAVPAPAEIIHAHLECFRV